MMGGLWIGPSLGIGSVAQGTGNKVPVGFASIRTVPGTLMIDQNRNLVVAPLIAGQGVPA